MKRWDNKKSQNLFMAVLSLQNLGEAKIFFRDLLTEEEILEFSRRYEAAGLLEARISYILIQKKTGLSSTTIARISKWLNGKLGGYRLALDRAAHHHTLLSGKEVS